MFENVSKMSSFSEGLTEQASASSRLLASPWSGNGGEVNQGNTSPCILLSGPNKTLLKRQSRGKRIVLITILSVPHGLSYVSRIPFSIHPWIQDQTAQEGIGSTEQIITGGI